MSHWFDRLSARASAGAPMTRRDAIKAAAAGSAAAGMLASPALASAGSALENHRRESACKCHDNADRRFDRANQGLIDAIGPLSPTNLITPVQFAFFGAASAPVLLTYLGQKLACGTCDRSPSGGKNPAPPSFAPCSPRGGLRRGPQCPGPGGGGNNDCPGGTSRCTKDLCCFGTDVCCACTSGTPTCCIQEIGCGCCA